MPRLTGPLAGLTMVLALVLPAAAGAGVLQPVYTDPPGSGFLDNRSVAPVPGNPATTRGGQRRAVFEAALDIWAARLDSEETIRVRAGFEDLGCGEDGVLGFGGPLGAVGNFPNAPRADTLYPAALAIALSGQQFDELDEALTVRLNSRVDIEECFTGTEGFWYGLDQEIAPPPGLIPFLPLVIHELAHGLGFSSLTDRETREFLGDPPRPGIESNFLFSLSLERTWTEMTAEQRKASSTSEPNLVWIGGETNLRAVEWLRPPAVVEVDPAISGQREFAAWMQGFAPFPPLSGISAPLVVADDGFSGGGRTRACGPLVNAEAVAGNIVLATRGECRFTVKWQNAFDAGAVGLVVADNVGPGDSSAISRDFQTFLEVHLPIPFWFVSRDTGMSLLAAPSGTGITLGYDRNAAPRGVNRDFVVMEASTDNPSANVVHFSTTALPPSLMWRTITNQAFGGGLDIVPDYFADLGWPDASGKLGKFSGNWFNPERDGEGCQLTLEDDRNTSVLTCYMYRDGDQFWLIGTGAYAGDRFDFNDMQVTGGADYGSAFRAADVERIDWGRIRMRLVDCNTATFDLFPDIDGLEDFRVTMIKIIQGDCQLPAGDQPDRDLSGNYFDPARDGEGIQLAVEADGTSHVVTWYTYLDGAQVWTIGTGSLNGDRIVFGDMMLTRGGRFGRAFRAGDIERIPFGTLTLDVLGCNNVRVRIEPELAEFEPSDRVLTRIVQRNC